MREASSVERPPRVLVRAVAGAPSDLTGPDLAAAVEQALDFLDYDFAGKRVWVKPNLLGAHAPDAGVTTEPALIHAVVAGLRRRNAADVWVFDNPGGSTYGNITDYIAVTGAVEASDGAFRVGAQTPHMLPMKSRFMTELPVSRFVIETDVILNLPVMKSHGLTILTGSIKNLYGIIPGGHKSALHRLVPDSEDFAELLVDIYQAVPVPVLTIMDALRGMDGQSGPSSGRVLKLGKLLAGANPVAVDSVFARMAGAEPDSIPMLRIAHDRGLGPALADIEIQGDATPIPGFHLPSRRVASFVGKYMGNLMDGWFRHAPVLAKPRCIKCRRCEKNCPVQAITMSPFPLIDRHKCIHCYCCAEICPEHALSIPSNVRSFWLHVLGR